MRGHSFPDHPVIANLERTGWPDGKEPSYPICPRCGSECETVYKDDTDFIFSCDVCKRFNAYDAYLEPECFPETEDQYG